MKKKYVITVDFRNGCKEDACNYVRLHDDVSWFQILDPNLASTFDKVKDAKEWIKTYTNLEEYLKVISLETAKNDYKKWVDNGTVMGERTMLVTEYSKIYNGEDRIEILNWRFKVRAIIGADNVSYKAWRTWPELYGKFKHITEVNVYNRYPHDDEKQMNTFQIKVNKVDDFETFEEEINIAIGILEENKDDIVFSIIDHDLCEHGSYFLLRDKNNKWGILDHHRLQYIGAKEEFKISTLKESFTMNTLKEVLKRMKTDHYYDDEEDEDEGNDYF